MTRPTEHSNARPASWQRKEEFSLAFERKQESRATTEIARSSVSLTCTVGSHTRIRRQSHSMVPSWYAYGITRSVYVNLRTHAGAHTFTLHRPVRMVRGATMQIPRADVAFPSICNIRQYRRLRPRAVSRADRPKKDIVATPTRGRRFATLSPGPRLLSNS